MKFGAHPFYYRLRHIAASVPVSLVPLCVTYRRKFVLIYFFPDQSVLPICPQIMIQRGSVFKTCCLRLKNHRWVRITSVHTHTHTGTKTPTLLALQPSSSIISCLVYSSLARAPISFSYFHPFSVFNMELLTLKPSPGGVAAASHRPSSAPTWPLGGSVRPSRALPCPFQPRSAGKTI